MFVLVCVCVCVCMCVCVCVTIASSYRHSFKLSRIIYKSKQTCKAVCERCVFHDVPARLSMGAKERDGASSSRTSHTTWLTYQTYPT
jgi:hypothetical protein